MPLVGLVSGPRDINIYTDPNKRLTSIQTETDGTIRYLFVDRRDASLRSWVEPQTGKMHVAGPEGNNNYIQLKLRNANSVNADVISTRPDHFEVSSLEIKNLEAAVTIMLHDELFVSVTVAGPPERLHEVRASVTADNLEVERRGASSHVSAVTEGDYDGLPLPSLRDMGKMAVTGWRWLRSNISEQPVRIDKSDPSPVKVLILVPPDFEINLTTSAHQATLGNLRGILKLAASGTADVYIGDMVSAELTANDKSTVHIESTTDNAVLVSDNKGTIVLDNGGSSVSASVLGAGSIRVGGTIESAVATIMGSGNIIFENKPTQLDTNRVGRGKIKAPKR